MADALPLSLATFFQGAFSFSSSNSLFALSILYTIRERVSLAAAQRQRQLTWYSKPAFIGARQSSERLVVLCLPTFRKVSIPIGHNCVFSVQAFWYIYWFNFLIPYTTVPHSASTVIYQAYPHTYDVCSYLRGLFLLLVALVFNIYDNNCFLIYLSSVGLRVGGLFYLSYFIWVQMFALRSRAAHTTCTPPPNIDPLATLTSAFLFIFIKTSPIHVS